RSAAGGLPSRCEWPENGRPMTGPAASNSDSRPEQRPTRVEDADLLRGRGRFADDLPEPRGVLHAAILRSPHGHAELVSIDASAALAMPGVACVVNRRGRAALDKAVRGRRQDPD